MPVPVVLEASASEVDKLLEHHLQIYCSEKQDQLSTSLLLRAWRIQLEEHFDSFGTSAVVKLVKTLNENLPNLRAEVEFGLLKFVQAQLALIMKLYRRNKLVDGTTKTEKIIAKELLQELLDIFPEVSERYHSHCPPQHIITSCNFTNQGSGEILAHTPYDVELMKLLMDCKIQVNGVDFAGDTILHCAVDLLRMQLHLGVCKCSSDIIECLTVLSQNGVWPNARNLYSEWVQFDTFPSPERIFAGRIRQVLKDWEYQYSMTLEYMATVVVIRCKIPYKHVLPTLLVKFVNMLGPTPIQCRERKW